MIERCIQSLHAWCQALYWSAFLYDVYCVVLYEAASFAFIYAIASLLLANGMHQRDRLRNLDPTNVWDFAPRAAAAAA